VLQERECFRRLCTIPWTLQKTLVFALEYNLNQYNSLGPKRNSSMFARDATFQSHYKANFYSKHNIFVSIAKTEGHVKDSETKYKYILSNETERII